MGVLATKIQMVGRGREREQQEKKGIAKYFSLRGDRRIAKKGGSADK